MSDEELTPGQVKEITDYVDIEAPPPEGEPTALILFGTNQAAPAVIAAGRYHRGLAPLLIATGGVNRHNGIVEGREFARLLAAADVPGTAVHVEDQSANTWQNVELSLPYLREALGMGLRLTVMSKWYHRRAVHALRTLLPEAAPFYAISWEPLYAGMPVTRDSWPDIPDGRRRVVRESQEIPRRVADGSYRAAEKADGAWQLYCRWPCHRGPPHLADRDHGGDSARTRAFHATLGAWWGRVRRISATIATIARAPTAAVQPMTYQMCPATHSTARMTSTTPPR